jgi:hypothetical protein
LQLFTNFTVAVSLEATMKTATALCRGRSARLAPTQKKFRTPKNKKSREKENLAHFKSCTFILLSFFQR